MSDRGHYFLSLSVFFLQEVKTSSFFKFNSTLLHINIQNKRKKKITKKAQKRAKITELEDYHCKNYHYAYA